MCDLRGAAMAHGLFMDILIKEQQKWICRHCKGKTTILSEICSKCGKEDLEQGEKRT